MGYTGNGWNSLPGTKDPSALAVVDGLCSRRDDGPKDA